MQQHRCNHDDEREQRHLQEKSYEERDRELNRLQQMQQGLVQAGGALDLAASMAEMRS
jgi:hypothetical protein